LQIATLVLALQKYRSCRAGAKGRRGIKIYENREKSNELRWLNKK
jgi:hypothetical protein